MFVLDISAHFVLGILHTSHGKLPFCSQLGLRSHVLGTYIHHVDVAFHCSFVDQRVSIVNKH